MAKSISVEEARAVLNRERDRERREEIASKRALIGKCYRFRNSFGDGKHWWLYTKVVGVNRWGHVQGLSFQAKSNNSLEIEIANYISLSRDWKEITPSQYENAKRAFVRKVVQAAKQ